MKTLRLLLIIALAAIAAACSTTPQQTELKDAYSDSFMIGCAVIRSTQADVWSRQMN